MKRTNNLTRAISCLISCTTLALLSACGGNDGSPAARQATTVVEQQVRVASQKSAANPPDAYAATVQQLYVAYFGRPADYNGLISFEAALSAANAPTDASSLFAAYKTNPAVKSLVDSFGNSAESSALYSAGTTTEFVTAIFKNVLGRAPAQAGQDFWVNAIDSGQVSMGNAALGIMVGALSNSSTQGQLDAQLVNNRIATALEFTSLMSSPADILGYRGAAAASSARNMLALVTAGTDSAAFYVTVEDMVASLARYTVNVSVTGLNAGASLTLQDNGGDNMVISANTSSTFATQLGTGASASVVVSSQPNGQFCHVINGHQQVDPTSSSINVAIFCTVPHAYVLNYNAVSASQFTVLANGSLSASSIPTVATGFGPSAIAIDPAGKYAYVANNSDKTVSQYTFDADRNLVPMATPTVASGKFTTAIAVDPQSRYVYAANYMDYTISEYRIGADGSLSSIGVTGVSNLSGPKAIAIDPSGKYVYVPGADGYLSQYSISQGGVLEPLPQASIATPYGASAIVIDAQGKYAYVTAYGMLNDDVVTQYLIGTDGGLTAVGTTSLASGDEPSAITIDPSGKFAYVTALFGKHLYQFSVGADGSLAPLAIPTVATGSWPSGVACDPSGKYVYVTNQMDGTVYQFNMASNGNLTPMTETVGDPSSYPFAIIVY